MIIRQISPNCPNGVESRPAERERKRMASLPALSRLAAAENFALFADQLKTALRLTLLLSLPAAAGLWAVGPRLVEGLLRHGAFGDSAAHMTGLALWAYLPGLPAFAVNRSLLAACNALGEARRTACSAAWAVAATLAVGAALVHSLSGVYGVMQHHLPITYVGLGEKMEDLRPFSGEDYARALLGVKEDA